MNDHVQSLYQPNRRWLTQLILIASCAMAISPVQDAVGAVVLFDPPAAVELPPFEPPIDFDIDGDGAIDYMFSSPGTEMTALPVGSNRVLIIDQFGTRFGENLDQDSIVGPIPQNGLRWDTSSIVLGGCASGGGGAQACPGQFQSGLDLLGLEFEIAGQTHYGWIEIESIQDFGPVRFHRWAYESEAGMPINAGAIPEPSTGLLLCLSLAACLRRRR